MDILAHSLVAPGPGPLHLAPGVTYPDQALHVPAVINLHRVESDETLGTSMIIHEEN